MKSFIICLIIIVYTVSESSAFLINFCPPLMCFYHCPNGYALNSRGCRTCTCLSGSSKSNTATSMTSPIIGAQTGGSHQMSGMFGPQANIQGSSYHNPCTPSQAYCILRCEKYMTGASGCQYCLCDDSIPDATTLPTTVVHHTSVPLINPCISSETTCDKSCNYGFLIGPNNCQYCLCSPYVQRITTETPTTSSSTLNNACIPSQKCTLKCEHGYVHGPSGCQYCLCAPNATQSVPTTQGPRKLYSNVNTMSEKCVIAIAICQVKCKKGFMTDKNDCTFCTCKEDIEAALCSTQGWLFGDGSGGPIFGPGGHMCIPLNRYCSLQCKTYEKDGSGCNVCHCKGDGATAVLTGPDHGTAYHTIHNPCIPTQSNCPLKCEKFVRGGSGCEFCMCANVHHETSTTQAPPTTMQAQTTTNHLTTHTPTPTTMGSTVSQDCIIARQICSAKCNGKYLVDPSDCTFCICKSEIHNRRRR